LNEALELTIVLDILCAKFIILEGATRMAKSANVKKDTKKKATKSLKEKRAQKKAKKENKS
jgi:predicted transcriptional regulator